MKLFNKVCVSIVAALCLSGAANATLVTHTENFDNGQVSSPAFETTGLHMISNGELYVYNRDVFRTSDEYFATESAPVFFDFTMTFMGGNMAFLAMRSSDNPYDPNHEPADGLILRLHNFQNGHTGIGENYLQNYEFHNPTSGDTFYTYNQPISVSMADYGSYVDISLENEVTNEVNSFTYNTSFSAGGYYGFATSGGIKFDDVSLSFSPSSEANAEPSEVPDPGSLAMLGLGLMAAGAYGSRSKKAK